MDKREDIDAEVLNLHRLGERLLELLHLQVAPIARVNTYKRFIKIMEEETSIDVSALKGDAAWHRHINKHYAQRLAERAAGEDGPDEDESPKEQTQEEQGVKVQALSSEEEQLLHNLKAQIDSEVRRE